MLIHAGWYFMFLSNIVKYDNLNNTCMFTAKYRFLYCLFNSILNNGFGAKYQNIIKTYFL